MRLPTSLVLAATALAVGACGQKLPRPPSAPPPAPSTRAGAVAAKRPPAVAITDEMLTGFAAFRREMLPMNTLAMGMGVGANGDGAKGLRQPANALTAEERLKRLSDATEQALENARVTREEITALTPILTPYYVQRGLVLESEEALAAIERRRADGKAQPADDALAEVYRKQLQKDAELRAAYQEKYGAEALEVLDRHEREFLELATAELESVLGK